MRENKITLQAAGAFYCYGGHISTKLNLKDDRLTIKVSDLRKYPKVLKRC